MRYFVEVRVRSEQWHTWSWTREGCNLKSMRGFHAYPTHRAALSKVRKQKKTDPTGRYRVD